MLPGRNRLQTQDFPNAARGRRLPFLGGTLVFIPDTNTFRAGIVVSKKIAKTAIRRNRIRRRMYAALYEILPTLPAGTCTVFPDASAATVEFSELVSSLRKVFKV